MSRRADFPRSSLAEGLGFTALVAPPNVARGLFRRRPRVVAALDRLCVNAGGHRPLAAVDLVVVAAAGAARHLVDRTVLEALGPEGYLINIARGGVVDQDALVELLADGGLAGAGLDVFTDEPRVPAELYDLDNVVLFPHVGSATARTRTAMALLAIRNLESYLDSGQLVTPVLQPRG